MSIMQMLLAAGEATGPLTLTFLGGREDLNPGRTVTVTGAVTEGTFTMPTSVKTALTNIGETCLVVAVVSLERTKLYTGSSARITDDDSNVWTEQLVVTSAAGTSSGSEVIVMTCELSTMPDNFSVWYNSTITAGRACNTAFYAIQNYSSTTPVSTAGASTATGWKSSDGVATITGIQSGDIVLAGYNEDADLTSPGLTEGTEDLFTNARQGTASGNTAAFHSIIATGTSQTFTAPADGSAREGAIGVIAFR